jgi:transporter family-2 protein
MSGLFFALLAALAGTGQPIQAAMNAELREGLGAPFLASCVQFLIAATVLGVLVASGWLGRGSFAEASKIPWWAWLGGAIGAVSVTVNLLAVKEVGAGTTIGAALIGQLLAAIVVDHFGWLGVERTPLDGTRIAGVVLLLSGIVLIQKR